MDLTRCGAWRPLALVFGLIVSPSVFAQSSLAALDCQVNHAEVMLIMSDLPDCATAPVSVNSCSASTRSISGIPRYGYTMLVQCQRSNGSILGSNGFGSLLSPPSSGVNRTSTSSGFFYWDPSETEPEPQECPDHTAPEFTGWKAPTPNGSGTICLNGCVAEIALSPPPGPLYLGQWTGATCAVDNAMPAETPELPEDPEAPGTDDPSDPNAPDGTGGGGFTCDTPPVCKADSITCSSLYQQWRTRCDAQNSDLEAGEQRDAIIDGLGQIGDGVDGLGSGLDRIGDGIDGLGNSLDGVNDRLDGTNNRLDGTNQRLDGIGGKLDGIGDGIDGLGSKFGDVFGDGPVGDDWLGGMTTRDVVLDSSKLDDSGMGLSRTCPAVLTNSTSFSFFGYQYTLKFEMFCAMLELVGQLLVVLAAFVGVRILLKSTTG